MSLLRIMVIYLIFINTVSFFVMGIDKHKARKHAFRIPESSLFFLAVIGGSAGSIAGMYLFRHKTRHLQFVIGMPVILALQILLCLWYCFYSPFTIKIM